MRQHRADGRVFKCGCGGEGFRMKELRNLGARLATAVTTLTVGAMTFAGEPSGPFAGNELNGATDVVNGFLAIGAAVVIALAIYKLGKRGVSRV